jgi:serine O-acetyltransferase
MFENLSEDLDTYAFRKGWPRWCWVGVPLFYTTSWPIITYRFNRWVVTHVRVPVIRQLLRFFGFIAKRAVETLTTVEISERAGIGKGVFIAHLGSIVISHHTRIGKYASLHQGATFGGAGRGEKFGGPTIGDRVYVGAGAKIIGKVRVGNDVMIGCNAVVVKDVPAGATVGGVPARVINQLGSRGWVHFRGDPRAECGRSDLDLLE